MLNPSISPTIESALNWGKVLSYWARPTLIEIFQKYLIYAPPPKKKEDLPGGSSTCK